MKFFKKNLLFTLFFILACISLSPCQAIENKSVHKSPILTTTAIIEIFEGGIFKGIVLIERGKAPWGKALPGGKVEYGETVEDAVRREMREEVNLELHNLQQFHVYSEPTRDFRHHSIEVTYIATAFESPKAGDDAAQAWIIKIEDIPWDTLAFDHAEILKDYLSYRSGKHELAVPLP